MRGDEYDTEVHFGDVRVWLRVNVAAMPERVSCSGEVTHDCAMAWFRMARDRVAAALRIGDIDCGQAVIGDMRWDGRRMHVVLDTDCERHDDAQIANRPGTTETSSNNARWTRIGAMVDATRPEELASVMWAAGASVGGWGMRAPTDEERARFNKMATEVLRHLTAYADGLHGVNR